MELAIRDLLVERSSPVAGKRTLATLALSILVHAVLFGSFLFAPMLTADEDPFPEYVAVTIVPAQMLGTTAPTPARSEPEERSAPPPEPEPEPEPQAPAPQPERKVMPEPQKKAEPPKLIPKRVATRPTASTPAQREGSATGSTLGTSNFGTAVAGFDHPDFTYDYYVDQMLAKIRQYWRRPSLGGSVEATVGYRILKDGRVVDVRILQSSGYNSFDLAAMRALQSASPLPPLPQSFNHDSLGVNLVVR